MDKEAFYSFVSIGSYIPGIAFLLGFSQQQERNPRQEVSASVAVASADSIDVKLRFPEVFGDSFFSYIFSKISFSSLTVFHSFVYVILFFLCHQYTVYRQAVPFPLPPYSFQELQQDTRNTSTELFA